MVKVNPYPPPARQRKSIVTSGPRAWQVNIGYVIGLLLSLAGALVATGRWQGHAEDAPDRLDAVKRELITKIDANDRRLTESMDSLKATMQAIREERVQLIAQGVREKELIHQDIRDLRLRQDSLTQGRK